MNGYPADPCQVLLSLVNDGHFSRYGRSIIMRAHQFAHQAHDKQQPRGDGRPFVSHPESTALIIIDELMIFLPRVIALAEDHDVVEDCRSLKRRILAAFSAGYERRLLAISRSGDKSAYHAQLMASEWEVLLVKLVDRLHNLRNILHMGKRFRRKQLKETKAVFFKFLRRLGETIPAEYDYAPGKMLWKLQYACRRIENSLVIKGRRHAHA